MKKYPKTPELIACLRPFWKELREALAPLTRAESREVDEIEKRMRDITGIKDLEFIFGDDGSVAGIGTTSRSMELIHDTELEGK